MNQTMNEAADRQDGSACVVEMTVAEQMKAFVAGIDDYVEDLRKRAVAAEAEAEVKKSFCAALPATLPIVPKFLNIGQSAYKADAELKFEIMNRDQVLALYKALPGVPVVMVAAGCTTFVPEQRFVEDGRSKATVTPVGELIYRLDSSGYTLREEYYWWCVVGDLLTRVTAVSKEGRKTGASAFGSSRTLSPTTQEVTWNYDNLPTGKIMRWQGGSGERIAPLTVHQERGACVKAALNGSQKEVVKFNANRCLC